MKIFEKTKKVQGDRTIKRYKFFGISLFKKDYSSKKKKYKLFGIPVYKKKYKYVNSKESSKDIYELYTKNKLRKKAIRPELKDWMLIKKKNILGVEKCIDILVPVYRGEDETLRCIYSVLSAKTKINYELIVINDKSPEKGLIQKLKYLSKLNLFTLIENNQNLGFLKTMNKSMQIHDERDVIWLNSDTEVFDYWIDRILSVADKNKKIATITPLSNNATICSYPYMCRDNFWEFDINDKEIDKICCNLNCDEYVESPTGVGFCMYVRREALKKVGLLDEIFNKGYGEENDLCQRFIKSGYINVITPAVFVRHYGSVSFKEMANGFCRENSIILNNKYPNYQIEVNKWIFNDPLRVFRIRIDIARLLIKLKNKKVVLHVLHNRGGGTEKFVNDLIHDLNKINYFSIKIIPENDSNIMLSIDKSLYPNAWKINMFSGTDEIMAVVDAGISNIHIHSLADYSSSIFNSFINLSKIKKNLITITIHDYHWICNKINLLNSSGYVCFNLKNTNCFQCQKNITSKLSTDQLRKYSYELFKNCSKITVPSLDVKKRFLTIFSDITFEVIPHIEHLHKNLIKKNNGHILNICVIGAIGVHKGFDLLRKFAKFIKENKYPAKIKIIGYGMEEDENIEFLGKYKNFNELKALLKSAEPSILFLPSIWPETYSYTLSEMISTGLPIACFSFGAPAERLKCLGLSNSLLPFELQFDYSNLLIYLERISKSNFNYEFDIVRNYKADIYYH